MTSLEQRIHDGVRLARTFVPAMCGTHNSRNAAGNDLSEPAPWRERGAAAKSERSGENRRMVRRAAATALALLWLGPSAVAQTYPHGTIKVISPFSAGGGTDYLARTIAQQLGDDHNFSSRPRTEEPSCP